MFEVTVLVRDPKMPTHLSHTPTVTCSTIVTIRRARADGKTASSLRRTIKIGVTDNCIGSFLLAETIKGLRYQTVNSVLSLELLLWSDQTKIKLKSLCQNKVKPTVCIFEDVASLIIKTATVADLP